MKQIIVLIATMLLGFFIFTQIAGDNDHSTMHSLKGVFQSQIEQQQQE